MKKLTQTTMDNETPFTVIAFGDYEIRQYWTSKNSGNGWQVLTVIFSYPEFYEYKTNGGGFNKTNAGLEWAFRTLEKQPRGFKYGDGIDIKYHIGGNFYRVSKSNIIKFKG